MARSCKTLLDKNLEKEYKDMNNIIEFLITNKFIIMPILIVTICLGLFAINRGMFEDMWSSSSFFGKIFTCVCVVISLPAIVIHAFISLCILLYDMICDLLFPRKSGYRLKVLYDKDMYATLKENKIYCEHWGQACLETSVIVFLWDKDYKKALKILPELQGRIVR